MASKTITIEDTKNAIDTGIIPGTFNESRQEFNFKTIESKNSRGKKLEWKLRVRLLDKDNKPVEIKNEYLVKNGQHIKFAEGWKGELTVNSKQEGGKDRDAVATYITTGKNLGKKNATNIITQTLRDGLSLYNKQIKKATTKEESKEKKEIKNADEFPIPLPMRPQKHGQTGASTLTEHDFKDGLTGQRKSDGARCLAVYDEAEKRVKLYSRTGAEFLGKDHIRKELEDVLSKPTSLSEFTKVATDCVIKDPSKYIGKVSGKLRIVFDGELYSHGQSLRSISGQARKVKNKKEGEDELLLQYHVYDMFFPVAIQNEENMISKCRQKYLDVIFERLKNAQYIRRVENIKITSMADIDNMMKKFRSEGYEGVIVRKDLGKYKYSFNNASTGDIIKFKHIQDEEFNIVGFTEGKGKDKGAIIWVAEVDQKNAKDPNDRNFSVVPKGMTLEERKYFYKCLSEEVKDKDGKSVTRFVRDFLNKPLTVEFSEISDKTGKPLQPKAITVRTYEDPTKDVVKQMYDECGKNHPEDNEKINPFPIENLETI
jgi:ATP-dependent DNA ligase